MASTSSDTPPIPVFYGDKYEHWRVKMRIFLQCQGLWEFVEPGYNVLDEEALKENRKKDATALSYIQQGLSDDQFDKIIEATTAREAWDLLEKEFKGGEKENDDVTETRTTNDNHESTSDQPVLAHPPPGAVPMHQMPSGYHNYHVGPFQPTPSYAPPGSYPNYHSQQPYLYPPPCIQQQPSYHTYAPPYQHGGSFYPPPPMQSSGGGLAGTLVRVVNKVEQVSGVKITGASGRQKMGQQIFHPMTGSQPPPTLPSITSSGPGGAAQLSLTPPEGGIQPAGVSPQMTHQNSERTSSIIGQQFVSSQPINLRITRKMVVPGEGSFDISDSNGNRLFCVKGKLLTLNDKRTMYDAFGNPLVTFCSKSMSMHDKWYAYRGNGTRSGMLFSIKRSSISMMQINASLDVYLTDNEKNTKNEKRCDYKVKGGLADKSFIVQSVETNSIVAEMSAKLNLQSIILDQDTYVITVYPNIDYAFISSLLVIFDGIVEDDKGGPSKYKKFLHR